MNASTLPTPDERLSSLAGYGVVDDRPDTLEDAWLRILQPASKELLPGHERFIEEAKPSLMLAAPSVNGVSDVTLHKTLTVVVIGMRHLWREYEQGQGGKLLASYNDKPFYTEETRVGRDYPMRVGPAGGRLSSSWEFTTVVLEPEARILGISMRGSKYGTGRDWHDMIKACSKNLPIFATAWDLSTELDGDFYNYAVDRSDMDFEAIATFLTMSFDECLTALKDSTDAIVERDAVKAAENRERAKRRALSGNSAPAAVVTKPQRRFMGLQRVTGAAPADADDPIAKALQGKTESTVVPGDMANL